MAHKSICSVDGCGKPRRTKGFCHNHYYRLWKHGDPLGGGTSKGEPQRFFREVVLAYDGDDCLIWPFSRNNNHYAQMISGGKLRTVSRLLCEQVNGAPPSEMHEAAHCCGRGREGCVTKRHLSWKTPIENQSDKIAHGTTNRGSRNGSSKLTADMVIEIRSARFRGMSQVKIGLHFGISQRAVSDILNGKKWRHIL